MWTVIKNVILPLVVVLSPDGDKKPGSHSLNPPLFPPHPGGFGRRAEIPGYLKKHSDD